jgi:hypothetical protein
MPIDNPYISNKKRLFYMQGCNDRLDGNEQAIVSDVPKYQYCYDRGYRDAGK